ncbi:50S ribosomal protein L2 [Candidatus Uhrbacteria bacterium RIFCSPHIGHO2_02_FULL_60_10]|uniref:Large ribosomal subunit protein uL2 n=1 Tax=Candidatus Uhrbacteria bacterium RIFCSPHIGHO2_02_FULL_60_10 TaxID=1802392 RepID=A0A1F7U2I7_9BACT|nr:MAG: 50S ribosomal protein L2 [Candidatus Uhrbacteria bacterium RIFCSPHIGHO2_02_FULL_60_10]
MGIRIYRPVTIGRRISSVDDFEDITKTEPEKSLIIPRNKMGGRNNQGKMTVRHRGGGAAQFVRIVDFKREKYGVPAKVAAIEYDPARGARLALLHYKDGEKRYIVAPLGMKVGETILSSQEQVEIKPGNRMPLEKIPVGVQIHDVELSPGQGGMVARGAGVAIQLMAIEGDVATLKLPSGEIRLFPKECMATVGLVSNPDHRLIRWGKAGRTRHRGRRPEVRGKAMNPVDHPHGGGEGKHPIGLIHPKTKWGKPALGVKTRDKKKKSWKFIVTRRK